MLVSKCTIYTGYRASCAGNARNGDSALHECRSDGCADRLGKKFSKVHSTARVCSTFSSGRTFENLHELCVGVAQMVVQIEIAKISQQSARCSVHVAVCCSVLQYVAVCCSVQLVSSLWS